MFLKDGALTDTGEMASAVADAQSAVWGVEERDTGTRDRTGD
jgi:hypothetical protein